MSNSFYDLELQVQNPATALLLQDGLPTSLISNYTRSKILPWLLECAADAQDLDELSEISSVFDLDGVKVLRVSEDAGSTMYLGPEFYQCLEDSELFIFAISLDDGWLEESPQAVAYRFLWLVACQKHLETWARITCYKLLLKQVGMAYVQPLPLRNSPPEKKRDWGFGPKATCAELELFSDHVKAYCEQVPEGYVADVWPVKIWLQKKPRAFASFAKLLDAHVSEEFTACPAATQKYLGLSA